MRFGDADALVDELVSDANEELYDLIVKFSGPTETVLGTMTVRLVLTDADRNEITLPLHLEVEATIDSGDSRP